MVPDIVKNVLIKSVLAILVFFIMYNIIEKNSIVNDSTEKLFINKTLSKSNYPNRIECTLKEIVSVDMIRVKINTKEVTIKLLGVKNPSTGNQYSDRKYNKIASDYLNSLIGNNTFKIEPVSNINTNNIKAYLFNDEGVFVNSEMIKNGYALFNKEEQNNKYNTLFKILEREARDKRRGLWNNLEFLINNPI